MYIGTVCCVYFLPFFSSLLGKVHGSLARAGKVKGQTPKVGCCAVNRAVVREAGLTVRDLDFFQVYYSATY